MCSSTTKFLFMSLLLVTGFAFMPSQVTAGGPPAYIWNTHALFDEEDGNAQGSAGAGVLFEDEPGSGYAVGQFTGSDDNGTQVFKSTPVSWFDATLVEVSPGFFEAEDASGTRYDAFNPVPSEPGGRACATFWQFEVMEPLVDGEPVVCGMFETAVIKGEVTIPPTAGLALRIDLRTPFPGSSSYIVVHPVGSGANGSENPNGNN